MHPYERIAHHYRTAIRDGQLAPGTRLPAIREAADEHGVATATVRHAYSWLQTEGLITTSPRGTFVCDPPRVASSPRDRADRLRRTGGALAEGEWVRVLRAELVQPPLHVAEIYDLEPGDQVFAREYVTGARTTAGVNRRAFGADWYHPALAEMVPELASKTPTDADVMLTHIEAATGRRPRTGRDAMQTRTAYSHEAAQLGIAPDAPILAMAYEWSDEAGVLAYGELCLPERVDVGYEYVIE